MDPHEIAQICHEANRALQRIQGDPAIPMAAPWHEVSPEMRNSAIEGVIGILNGATPEQSHENWLDFKTAHGWQYGPRKDESIKTHPCIVPYADLPSEQQLKDRLFHGIVHAIAG